MNPIRITILNRVTFICNPFLFLSGINTGNSCLSKFYLPGVPEVKKRIHNLRMVPYLRHHAQHGCIPGIAWVYGTQQLEAFLCLCILPFLEVYISQCVVKVLIQGCKSQAFL